MSTTSKKPPAPGGPAARRPSINPPANAASPARSPSRLASQNNSGNAATGTPAAGVSRARSVRTTAPVSARAAVRKQTTPTDSADEDARAEMQSKMDELHEQVRQAEQESVEFQKQAAVLQAKLDEALKEQSILEENLHEHSERINDLENEKKEGVRARREMEHIYETERAAALREKEDALAKQEEAQAAVQRMKETLAQKEMRAGLGDDGTGRPNLSRHSSFRNSANPSPNPEASDGQFAPPSSLHRSDSRSSSKLVLQKDKVIEGLRLELAEAQIKLVEVENMGGGRLQKLEAEMYDIKVQNARLMEENESFQLLLSEKTLNGDFSQSDFLRPPSRTGSRPSTPRQTPGNSLADELGSEDDGESSDEARRLQSEVSSLKDQNKALTLYINQIISRLLQHDQFEQILDKTPDLMAGPGALSRRYLAANTEKDLPPPPPPKDDQDSEQSAGFLQRARSVMGGRPKARPQSQIFDSHTLKSDDSLRVHENIDTAPQISLARANRMSGSHRRANSEWAAASLVNSMVRSPGISPGATSPGLTSPNSGRGFFAAPQPLGVVGGRPTPGSRVPSHGASSLSNVSESGKENDTTATLHRDSRPSIRNSVVSGTLDIADGQLEALGSSQPSSPPRSITSSGDRDSKPGSGAVMMGSKMRPLRLVQEAEGKDEAAKKAANRGSWFGFLNKGVAGPSSGAT